MAAPRLHRLLGWSTLALGLLLTSLTAWPLLRGEEQVPVEAYLVRPAQDPLPWASLSPAAVESGALIRASVHTVFHLPDTFERIDRETLLGRQGKNVRYWGYCFPQNYHPSTVESRTTFQGLLFLSEKERAVRAAEEKRRQPVFNPFTPPSDAAIALQNNPERPGIRHQLEIFQPNTLCYVMSEQSLAIGTDHDGDGLNSKLEREIGTDPRNPDSDGDGLLDGTEYFTGTDPLLRDTDGDNVIDGIEDKNRNGRVDPGETDPRVWDSDRDELCDGFCRVRVQGQWIFLGEDKNLNGIVDKGETDPTKWATEGEVSDYLRVMQCLATGKASEQCP